jgi:beta-glucanase (GH16 family)
VKDVVYWPGETLHYARADWVNIVDGVLQMDVYGSFTEDGLKEFSVMESRQNYLYGYFEFKASFPLGTGLNQAIWMWNRIHTVDLWAEIDLNEPLGDATGYAAMHLHGHQTRLAYAIDNIEQYHLYGCRWLPGEVCIYVDNELAARFTTDISAVPLTIWADMSFMPDDIPPDAVWPQSMYIAWIKAWRLN